MKTTKALWAVAAFAAATFTFDHDRHIRSPFRQSPQRLRRRKAVATGRAPAAIILFLDRGTVLRQSAVGKGMYAQVEALAKKMETDFAPENKKLQADVQALQSQAAVLSPEVRQQKVKELEARRQAFQKKVQDRQAAIQAGLANSRTSGRKGAWTDPRKDHGRAQRQSACSIAALSFSAPRISTSRRR